MLLLLDPVVLTFGLASLVSLVPLGRGSRTRSAVDKCSVHGGPFDAVIGV